jgi:hypothetical protein
MRKHDLIDSNSSIKGSNLRIALNKTGGRNFSIIVSSLVLTIQNWGSNQMV